MQNSEQVQAIAQHFGSIETPTPEIQAEIERLSRQPFLELERVKLCHSWMYELFISRMTGLLVGDSRSGKTVTSKAFAARCNKLKFGLQGVYFWDAVPKGEHPNFARRQERGDFIRDTNSRIKSQLCGCCNNEDNDCS